ncbi:uncharacterized protein ACRADG_009556 [Cochliomyia hominivorax]
MDLIIYIIITIVFLWIMNLWNSKESIKLGLKIPSNKLYTILGFGKIFRGKESIQHFLECGAKYGQNSLIWSGPISFFLTTDPNAINKILMSRNCINKPSIVIDGITWTLGLGLLSSKEPWWSRHRKIISKAFFHTNVLTFVPLFNREINRIIKIIDQRIENKENIELMDLFEQLALKTTTFTMLKRDLDEKKFDLVKMTKYFIGISDYVSEACLTYYNKINVIFELAKITKYKQGVEGLAVYRELINESWEILKENTTNGTNDIPDINSTLDYVFKGVKNNVLKEEEISGTLMHLLAAGVDTTSSVIYFVILMLAMYPQYQERLYGEILNLIPDCNEDKDLTWEELNKFSYLEMVLNETMRILTPVPGIVRQVCHEKLNLDNGITLPVGQYVLIDIFGLHRREEIWGPKANVFNPDNFLPSNIASRHSSSFIPFIKGWRSCLDCIQYLNHYANKHGSDSLMWVGPFPIFLTRDPKTAKNILMSKNCINKPSIILNGLTLTLGLGLVSASDPWWSRHRKVLNKAFSNKNLLSFIPLFNKEVNRIIEQIDRSLEKGEHMELMELFEKLTLKIASATILKRDLDPQTIAFAKMVEYIKEIAEYVSDALINVFCKIDIIFQLRKLTRFKKGVKGVIFYKELINESWCNLKENNTGDYPEMNSALDYVLNGVKENVLYEEEICSSILHLFFGAFDTTASTSFYALVFLAMFPEYQQRLYDEIMSILPTNSDSDLTWEVLNKFSYLEMVLNETMRLAPAIPQIAREVCHENLTVDNGFTIPVGQCLVIDIFSLHRSKEIWGPNANVFNPNNFLPSNVDSRDPFTFIPFVKGIRFCIGGKYAMISLKISLIKILKRYRVTTDFKYEDLQFQNQTVLKLVKVPQLYFQRREII